MTQTRCLGIIGFGAIARSMVDILAQQGFWCDGLVILARPESFENIRSELAGSPPSWCGQVTVCGDLETFLAAKPDLVVECAGHSAVTANFRAVFETGADVILASTGALSDPDLFDLVYSAASIGSGQVILPAGAVGGIDVLAAARLSGISSVTYTGRKPAVAWRGTPAEDLLNLAALTEPTVFFEGTARAAAATYPKNANVAATLALAGIGMDKTKVCLIADPSANANTHEYSVVSNSVEYSMCLAGKASAQNPKTSMSTVYSIVRVVLNRSSAIVI